jgi:phage baseplate assembly protein W
LAQSLQQHISLIITTRLGDCRFEPDFGCKIWDVDFVVPSNLNSWKEEIKAALQEAIQKHERRIEQIQMFNIQVAQAGTTDISRIQQRLEIELRCALKGTHDTFSYTETLYFSPVSLV